MTWPALLGPHWQRTAGRQTVVASWDGIPVLLSVHLHPSSLPVIFTAPSMLNRQEHEGFLNAAINKTVIKLSV